MIRLHARTGLLVAFLLTSAAVSGPATAPATSPSESVELWVFRIAAMGGMSGLEHASYAEHASLDEATRKELLGLIDRHRERVGREVAGLREQPALPPYEALVTRAGTLDREYRKTTAAWFEKHPQAERAIQRHRGLTTAAWIMLASDREMLLQAWSKAGGPPEKLPEARQVVHDAYGFVIKANEVQRRQWAPHEGPPRPRSAIDDFLMYEVQFATLEAGQRVHRGLRELIEEPRQREAFESSLLSSISWPSFWR